MLRDRGTEINGKGEGSNGDSETLIKETPQSDDTENTIEEKVDEVSALNELLSEKEVETKEHLERFQRLAAEFDNFRKRTQKEKDKLYGDAVSDVVAKFLPVIDNLERALKASGEEENHGLKEGVVLVFRQMADILVKLDIKAIDTVGTTFNPEIHNAVMHVEDDTLDHNIVVEEFQKGYIYKDEFVIRHSMVKVAN